MARNPTPKSKRAPFLAVAGHTNLDIQMRVKELPSAGHSTPVLERAVVRGGTACNVAVHAASLGLGARLWSRVGQDFPADWRTDLDALDVDLRHLDIVSGQRTPVCYVFTDLLDRQSFVMDQGPMADMAANGPPASFVEDLPPGSWLHLSTGDPLAYAVVADAAKRNDVQVGLDPGQELAFQYDRRRLEGLLAFTDVLFLNDAELRVACDLLHRVSPEDLLEHVPTLVLTRGASGASLYRRGAKSLHSNAFVLSRVVDPTGAGDALRSGWYAALARGKAMPDALRWGQAAAATTVQNQGPQSHPVTVEDLQAYVADAR